MLDGYDVLTGFAQWWMASRPLRPPFNAFFTRVGGNTGLILYRQDAFQVQLFLNDPNSSIVDHVHPNVDSYEVYLAGQVYFRLNGEQLLTQEMCETAPEQLLGKMIRIHPSDLHGADIGPKGGAFLSIQHWIHGTAPSSVELDWNGPSIDAEHAKVLGKGLET